MNDLDPLFNALYRAISFPEGGSPDYALMAQVFSEHARITRVTPEGIDYLDLTAFRGLLEEMLEIGAYTSFFELETERRVDRYGDVIHVASGYETRVSPRAKDHLARGVNSLQLIRESGKWKILSLCWDDHARPSVRTAAAGAAQGA